MRELSLADVAAEVTAWRKTKQHKTSALPKEIADHIIELAKSHKTHDIMKALQMSTTTVTRALQKAPGLQSTLLNNKQKTSSKMIKCYHAEEKLALCEEWKRSGITAEQFCKTKGISKSTLYKWQHRRQASSSSQTNEKRQNWLLINPPESTESPEERVSIELTLPNQAIARIQISRMEAINFFQELYHAIATVR